MRLLAASAAVAVGLLAAAAGAAGQRADDPGVTPTTILLGTTAPLASAEGAVARGAAAYFKYVNARGGVHGRAIVQRVVVDRGDAVQATRRLVEQDRVFAIVGSAGADENLAARDYLNAARVPQLFAASGATALGDFRRAPWTIGFQPSHRFEGWVYGRYLGRARPDAAVGVLLQDDEYGRELLAGLREGLSRSKARVVATQAYAPTAAAVQSQVARLKAAGANVLALFATPRVATQALAAWRPTLVILAADGRPSRVGEGALSLGFLKDPADGKWRDDPAMRLYRTIMARYAPAADTGDAGHIYGMAVAYETVKLLQVAGKTPTRASVLARLSKLNDPSNPFLLPGIHVRTTATERFPVEQAQLRRFTGGRWRAFGGLWSYSPGRG